MAASSQLSVVDRGLFCFVAMLAVGRFSLKAKSGTVRLLSTTIDVSQFANKKEITKQKVQEAIMKHQKHKSDTGSPSAQIAAATEKILSLSQHFASHKKDHSSFRGYQALLTHRRIMLEYLKRKDIDEYNRIVVALGLSGKKSSSKSA